MPSPARFLSGIRLLWPRVQTLPAPLGAARRAFGQRSGPGWVPRHRAVRGCCPCLHGDRIAAGAEPRGPSPHESCVPRLSSGAARLAERRSAYARWGDAGRQRCLSATPASFWSSLLATAQWLCAASSVGNCVGEGKKKKKRLPALGWMSQRWRQSWSAVSYRGEKKSAFCWRGFVWLGSSAGWGELCQLQRLSVVRLGSGLALGARDRHRRLVVA